MQSIGCARGSTVAQLDACMTIAQSPTQMCLAALPISVKDDGRRERLEFLARLCCCCSAALEVGVSGKGVVRGQNRSGLLCIKAKSEFSTAVAR